MPTFPLLSGDALSSQNVTNVDRQFVQRIRQALTDFPGTREMCSVVVDENQRITGIEFDPNIAVAALHRLGGTMKSQAYNALGGREPERPFDILKVDRQTIEAALEQVTEKGKDSSPSR